ncbi:MAG: glycerol-3-phosphate 1-O-acyltransferase PlsY [Clostridiales Family XIII bacterium]|jgi:glycerol-3-phosphate acyltransferase PlsY|nr:glycerol-3-phosphate 1-O-acyltransferase PlsY [Clostridiales Family XIII bacterium]
MVIIAAVLAYFIGNINPAILIGRAYGVDVRKTGSGNAGTTNAIRSIGKKAGALTFAIDVFKGWLCFFAASEIGTMPMALICGFFVVLGHMYPAVFKFKGGKGVATAFGALLAACWWFALILIAVVIVMAAIFRRVSLGVMAAAAVALVIAFNAEIMDKLSGAADYFPWWVLLIIALVVWKHRGNINRLVHGTEPKLSFGKSDKKKEEA